MARGTSLRGGYSRLFERTRRAACFTLGASCACSALACGQTDPVAPPLSPPVPTTTVFAVVRGTVSAGNRPVALALVKIWGFKDACRVPLTDSPLVVADSLGRYERIEEYLGSPGRACFVVRFLFQTAGAQDSIDSKDNFVNVKAKVAGAVPDTVVVDGKLP